MDETCEECGKPISKRAKANIWRGEHIVCTICLGLLNSAVTFDGNKVGYLGKKDALWLVNDGETQHGPYSTEELIELLRSQWVKWDWRIWREGMKKWKRAAGLFTMPEFSKDGQIKLHSFDGPKPPRLF
jgi:GYF domain 2